MPAEHCFAEMQTAFRCVALLLAASALLLPRSAVAEQYGSMVEKDGPYDNESVLFVETESVLGTTYWDNLAEGSRLDLDAALDPNVYEVTSETDAAFRQGLRPVRVGVVRRGYHFTYRPYGPWLRHQILLELAEPLKWGHAYSVRRPVQGAGGESETLAFSYGEGPDSGARAIQINHFGYLAGGPKIACVGRWLGTLGTLPLGDKIRSFRLLDAETERVVFEGPAAPRRGADHDRAVGHELLELDFTAIREPGAYLLEVPGIGRTHPFAIGDEAYRPLLRIMAHSLYHQRCGIELKPEYTSWTRPACHLQAPVLSEHGQHDGGGAFSQLPAKSTGIPMPQAVGGYHDAGDFDRQAHHLLVPQFLLELYEHQPEKFVDGAWHLPESGNGVPDIVDEARWCVGFFARLQDDDGGVHGGVETHQHPAWGMPPWEDREEWYVYAKDPATSLLFAATAAWLSRTYAGLGKAEDASSFLDRARRSYDWAMAREEDLPARTNLDQGMTADDLVAHAALELYRATGETVFHDVFLERFRLAREPGLDLHAYSNWHGQMPATSYASEAVHPTDADLVAACRAAVVRAADATLGNIEATAYREGRDPGRLIWWGAGTGANYHQPLMRAWFLTGEPKYRDGCVHIAGTWLGVNPLGVTWITGAGYRCVANVLNMRSHNDGIPEPVPGLPIFGPLALREKELASNPWYDVYYNTFLPPREETPELYQFAALHWHAMSLEYRVDVYQAPCVQLMFFLGPTLEP
jgi:endoglucanase